MSGKWYAVILIYISLIMGEVDQIFICLRVICISFSVNHSFSAAGDFAPQGTFGNIWKHFCLSQLEGGAIGISWIDARGAVKHLIIYEAVLPQQKVIWLKMSIVPSLKNPTGNVSIDHFSYRVVFLNFFLIARNSL